MRATLFLIAAMVALPLPAAAAVYVTFEAPGVQTTTQNGNFGVETFANATAGFDANYSDTQNGVTFAYTGVDVRAADQYGGAGGTSLYAATYSGLSGAYAQSTGSYTLNVSSAAPINFFGAWFSAQDLSNVISFYRGNALVYTFTPANLLAATLTAGDFKGNPNPNFLNDNASQTYVFANLYFSGGTYDRIVFAAANLSGTGFETDNHTVGTYIPPITGTPVGPVPDAAAWTLMVAGFGMIGLASRKRRTAVTC